MLHDSVYYINKRTAYSAVARARRLGELVPEPCEVCGDTPSEGHHRWGYEPENALRVAWLCGLHHGQEHERMRHEARGETLAPCLRQRCYESVWATPNSLYRYCFRHMVGFIERRADAALTAFSKEGAA